NSTFFSRTSSVDAYTFHRENRISPEGRPGRSPGVGRRGGGLSRYRRRLLSLQPDAIACKVASASVGSPTPARKHALVPLRTPVKRYWAVVGRPCAARESLCPSWSDIGVRLCVPSA